MGNKHNYTVRAVLPYYIVGMIQKSAKITFRNHSQPLDRVGQAQTCLQNYPECYQQKFLKINLANFLMTHSLHSLTPLTHSLTHSLPKKLIKIFSINRNCNKNHC